MSQLKSTGNLGGVIVVMGAPNAGKGTQARKLGEFLGAVHFSTGDLMRKENDPKIMALTNTGALAPPDYIRRLIAKALDAAPHDRPVVIDGAKMLPEATWLVGVLPSLGRHLEKVVVIRISEEESRNRSRARGHGRLDDDAGAQDLRWERFRADVIPTMKYYRELGLLVEVDGLGTPDEVASRVRAAVGLTA